MNIVVAVRCYNEARNIARFINGYSFADTIVISDGGSTDGSVEIIKAHPLYDKVKILHFTEQETVNGQTWNPDHSHMNFVLDAAKELKPDWLLFDDADCWPNTHLKKDARSWLRGCTHPQINVFRLYLWGETGLFFPKMNNYFDPSYRSLWGWKPSEIDIYADPSVRHGTLVGLTDNNHGLDTPYCLLHYSWYPDTIQAKVDRYNALGLPMQHPLDFAGKPEPLPDWARE